MVKRSMRIRTPWRLLVFSLFMVSLFLPIGVRAESRSLDGLLTHVDLFETETQSTGKQTSSEISLGKINSQSLTGSKINLLADFISIGGSYTFSLKHEPNTPADELPIMVVPIANLTGRNDLPPPPGKLRTEPVASLKEKSGTLYFVWNLDNETVHASQLANAQLQFVLDSKTHTVFFRNPASIGAVPLDLAKILFMFMICTQRYCI